MSIINSCKKRYATKVFDETKPLTKTQIDKINTVLKLSPSSLNIQPWRFIGASTSKEKERIAKACPDAMSYNATKIQQASYVVVFCAQQTLSVEDLSNVIRQEEKDGRYLDEKSKQVRKQLLMGYLEKKQQSPSQLTFWLEKQVYIALGGVLLATADMGIDSVAIEGFDANILNKEFDLELKQLNACVIAAFGMQSKEDFNARLPKSRFDENILFLS